MMRVFICGDIVNRFSNRQFVGQQLQTIIQGADYSIGNFEGTLPFDGIRGKDMVQDVSTLNSLKEAGFDLLLLSNNHIGDYGYKGFASTVNAIKEAGFDTVGSGFSYEEAYEPLIKEICGIKMGFINVCEAICCLYKSSRQRYGCAWTGAKILESIIPTVKKEVDILIVLPHSGLELNPLPMAHTRELYRHYCDLGADVIVASHPHIPQGVEDYDGKYIFYSLGNFYFPESEECDDTRMTNQSYSLLLEIDGSHINYEVVYHRTNGMSVELDTKPSFSFEHLTSLINSPEYPDKIKEQDRMVFERLVYNLYKDTVLGMARKRPFKERIKMAFRLMMPISNQSYETLLKSFHKISQSETYINLIDSAISQPEIE